MMDIQVHAVLKGCDSSFFTLSFELNIFRILKVATNETSTLR